MKLNTFIYIVALFLIYLGKVYAVEFSDRNFAQLQRRYAEGSAAKTPWNSFWYPYSGEGIASRWNGRSHSPAEKYDILNETASAEWELYNHGSATGSPEWYGHCNGWATAAILSPEPRQPLDIDGIHFTVGDQKALLIEAYQDSVADYIGERVYDENDRSSSAFWDVIPAHFHLLLTNIVGAQRKSFILDHYTGAEVWNQPIVAYQIHPIHRSDYLGPHPEFSDVYRVNVTTTIWWSNDEDIAYDYVTPKFDMKNPDERAFRSRTLKYELWLDAPPEFSSTGELIDSGDIIVGESDTDWVGGVWKNGHLDIVDSHPDFIWIPYAYAGNYNLTNPNINREWVSDRFGGWGRSK